MDVECCLCRGILHPDKRRRVKFYGSSSETIRRKLQEIFGIPLDTLIKDKNALLCAICQKQLKLICRLEVKLAELRNGLHKKLSDLQQSAISRPSVVSRKRADPIARDCSKRIRLGSGSGEV